MLKEILTARTRPSDKALYNIWARKISDGWTETTITGSLPLTFRAKGDTLTDYTVHGTAAGAGARTENLFDKSTALTGYEISGSSIAENPLWFVTDYIKVDPQTSYIAPKSSWGTGCLEYASKGGEPTRRTFNNITGVTTLSTTQYIRLNSTIATIDSKMVVQGSTAPTTFIPYGYEIPLTNTSGQNTDTYPLYIGSTKLDEEEYVDYGEQKIYKDVSGTLTPTDPPAAFPAITAYQGENTLSSTETVGSVSVTGKIKEVTP